MLRASLSCPQHQQADRLLQGSAAASAPKRAKRANSRKRFREEEGYEEPYPEVRGTLAPSSRHPAHRPLLNLLGAAAPV